MTVDTPVGEHDLPALMIRYQAGDGEAVETLVRRLSPLLWRYLASPYVTTSDTEDLLQDCLEHVVKAWSQRRVDCDARAWTFTIMRWK